MTRNKGYGPGFGEITYISEVHDVQVATNKNSDPLQKFFLRGGWRGWCPNSYFSKLLELSETCRARKLILGLQFNIAVASYIDKANSQI